MGRPFHYQFQYPSMVYPNFYQKKYPLGESSRQGRNQAQKLDETFPGKDALGEE